MGDGNSIALIIHSLDSSLFTRLIAIRSFDRSLDYYYEPASGGWLARGTRKVKSFRHFAKDHLNSQVIILGRRYKSVS